MNISLKIADLKTSRWVPIEAGRMPARFETLAKTLEILL